MGSRRCFGLLGLALLVSACGSGGKGGAPPSVELVADPEVCDVPCEVVLDSGVDTRAGDGLTFTWDVGEGPVQDDARLLHTFEEAGAYEVVLTVAGTSGSTTETVTVLAQPQPKSSGSVDATGGSVSHGACIVTVPEGVAPEAFPIEIAELPSMQEAAERRLGADRFVALGNAYQIGTLVKSAVAFDLAVQSSETAGIGASELAWLVRMVTLPTPAADSTDPPPSLAPTTNYALVPVTGVDADGTAHGDIYGRSRVQLVRLNAPLDVSSGVAEASLTSKQSAEILRFVVVHDDPTKLSKQEYIDAALEALRTSHDFLVNKRGFLWLHQSAVVHVAKLNAKVAGQVPHNEQRTIWLNNNLATADEIKKVVAHEFFHLIQNWHSNLASLTESRAKDAWFIEGSATWAMDEVYDQIQGRYHATPRKRFSAPLVQSELDLKSKVPYQTVAFFKWAESEQSEIVRAVLQDRFARNHYLIGSSAIIPNTMVTDYLTSFKALWPDADFLQFAYDSLYEKDYDKSETRAGELWHEPLPTSGLGPPKKVQPSSTLEIEEGKGDSEANADTSFAVVLPHLTADLLEIQSKGPEGTLHVRFEQIAEPLDARVFVLDKASNEVQESYTVRDLSKKHEDVKLRFDPDKKAEVLVVDPRWSYPPSPNEANAAFDFWVESPCGPLPSNVIDATDEDELYAALTSAPAGSVVKLPAGTFVPPIRDWPLPEAQGSGEWPTQVLVKDVTLAGAGQGATTLSMRGNEFDAVGMATFGHATVRDLTIDARDFWGLTAIGAKSLTLCNVTIETRGGDAVQFSQWPGGGDGFIGIYNSTLTYTGGDRFSGLLLYCLDQSGNITAEIRDSNISGWYIGVHYGNSTENSCRVSVSTDCKGFGNNDYNVWHSECSPPDCDPPIEECP